MITKELVEQWATDNDIVASNAFRASRHDLDCMYKAWPEELLAFAQRAAAYGAAQQEKQTLTLLSPKQIWVDEGYYTKSQLEHALLKLYLI